MKKNSSTPHLKLCGKTEIAAEEPASELIAKEFRQSPTRLMSFVLDTGAIPSGITSQEQLDTWNEENQN